MLVKRDADDALNALNDLKDEDLGRISIDAETNKRIVKRIDLFIMPIMCLVYMVNFLDKTTLSYASIMGIRKDLSLTSGQYSWLGSLFYFGYLAWEYPTNRLLQRLPLAKYSAFCVIVWGVVLACFAAVENYAGSIAVRLFLGVMEASVTPGFALFTSQWYTTEEQGLRTGIWFSFNGWAQFCGGFIAYGIARGGDAHGYSIAAWRIVFLLTGCFTILIGGLFLILMPDNQTNAWWLSKRDRVLAIERVRANQQGIGNKTFKPYQFLEALRDPITWAFFGFAVVADIPNGGVTNFFSLMIESFGFTSEESLLYSAPAGLVEVVSLCAWGWMTRKWGYRILFAAGWMFVSLIGFIIILAVPQDKPAGRLVGYYLYNCIATGFVALLSLISTNIAGYTKKTSIAAIYLIGYCAGNIIGPQTFRNQDFVPPEITIVVCISLAIADLIFIHFYYKSQNSKKALLRAQPGYITLENQEWLDLTDKENHNFVYHL